MASESQMPRKPLSSYPVLTFDIFGTIIDWEAGIYDYLLPLLHQLPASHELRAPFPTTPASGSRLASRHPLIVAFDAHEARLCIARPTMGYEDLLRQSYLDLAAELGIEAKEEDAEKLGAGIGSWPLFPDSVAALQRLKKHAKLVALSNVSNASIAKVLHGTLADVQFDAVYTAEAIGSYKPAAQNFTYLLSGVEREFGVKKDGVLHIGHGVKTDHLRPEEMGFTHVWVERGVDNWEGTSKDGMRHLVIVKDLKELADEIER